MKSFIKIFIALMALLLVMTGCEYDGPTAVYFRPYEKAASPVISSIDPSVATAGYNYITINGENFSQSRDSSKVYVDGFLCETVETTSGTIKIRRPNRSGESTTLKVVNYASDDYAVFAPYKIDPVQTGYSGGYLDGSQLSVMAIDNNENVYLIQRNPRNVYKITPDGEQTIVGIASRIVTDVILDSEGNLVLLMQNKAVMKMDPTTGVETEWVSLDKRVASGDFDSNGNFYSGGDKSDLIILTSDLNESASEAYNDKKDDILCVRVHENYVYVIAEIGEPDENNPALAIWRHEILNATGTLGAKQLVLDWAATGEYAGSVLKFLTFSPSGMLIIGSDNINPLLMLNLETMQSDVLYKGILSASAEFLAWDSAEYLYMLQGGDTWQLKQIDMGTP